MITLIKEIPHVEKPNAAYAKILCHHAAYGEYEKIALFWQQTDDNGKLTALISSVDNEFTLYFKNGDTEELLSFLKVVSPNGIFTDHETACCFGFEVLIPCTSLVKLPPHNSPNKIENTYCGIDYVCDTLAERLNIGDKQAAHADIAHRVRHNCAAYVTSDHSAGVIIYSGDLAVINGIAVKSGMASKGLGSATLNRLLECVRNRTVFACARDYNVPFYLKNGFEIDEKAAYCKLG